MKKFLIVILLLSTLLTGCAQKEVSPTTRGIEVKYGSINNTDPVVAIFLLKIYYQNKNLEWIHIKDYGPVKIIPYGSYPINTIITAPIEATNFKIELYKKFKEEEWKKIYENELTINEERSN